MSGILLPLLLFAGLLASAHCALPYYGKLIQSGWGAGATHRLNGNIYAIDENSFQVIRFQFDGLGPDAAFLLGTRQMYDAVRSGSGVDTSAVVLANPMGQSGGLRRQTRQKVVLHLPAGRVLTDFTYIAVGDRRSKRLYGGAPIPTGFVAPAPRVIGTFQTAAHGVSSGTVTVLNDRMIKIEGFRYDGQGPDAFFYVGVTNDVVDQAPPYGKIPDENGVSDMKAGAYTGQDIILTLPDTISATNLKWLSMWCVSFSTNFGDVRFPSQLSVPPYVPMQAQQPSQRPTQRPTQPRAQRPSQRPAQRPTQRPVQQVVRSPVQQPMQPSGEKNCEPLSDNLKVSWFISGDTITIELAGNIDRNTDYMAFGLSGSDSSFSMIGADVVVADFKENRAPRAVDYFITAYAQCSINGGVCPDTSTSNSGNNDVMMPTGMVTNGNVRIKYKRALVTNDGNTDKEYKVDGTPQQIVWAIGPLNSVDEAAKHYPNGRISTAKTINFGRRTMNNCPSTNNQEETGERRSSGAAMPTRMTRLAPQAIGMFQTRAHGVSSGTVTVLNDRMIKIEGFRYDGQGPDAFFYVGVTNDVVDQALPYGKIPDENGVSDRKAGVYTGQDIILTLPDTISAKDLKWLSMWCVAFSANFGEVRFPSQLSVPAYVPMPSQQPTQQPAQIRSSRAPRPRPRPTLRPQAIGMFQTRGHGVSSGTVTVLNDRMIKIEGFRYDGQGPDAFFYVGVTNDVVDQAPPYGKIPDENGVSDRKAGVYTGQDIILTLPDTISANDLKWLSMWCVAFSANFGEVRFPSQLSVPAYVPMPAQQPSLQPAQRRSSRGPRPTGMVTRGPQVIGMFQTRGHGVSSGPVTVLNDRMIKIEGFRYDGQGPDAFFYVGVTNDVVDQAPPYGKIPDENGVSNRKAGVYTGQDIILTLPDTISANDLKWLSMWCVAFSANFGEVRFPSQLSVPAYVPMPSQQPTLQPAQRRSSRGPRPTGMVTRGPQVIGMFQTRGHGVSSGPVTVLNDRMIKIEGFRYDGQGPDAFFYVGVTNDVVDQAPPYGKIPDENGVSDRKAGVYTGQDIILTLPDTISANDLKWLSMWCVAFSANFGEVRFPSQLSVPAYVPMSSQQPTQQRRSDGASVPTRVAPLVPQVIGMFQTRGHGVSSGPVTVLNDRMIKIEGFRYDGQGPDAFFYVGVTNNVVDQAPPYGKIPDENGISNRKAGVYTGQDIILTLPDTISANDLKWLSMWCVAFSANFGEVRFPSMLSVPAYVPMTAQQPTQRSTQPPVQPAQPSQRMNCEPLSDNLQVSWIVSGDTITMELAGNIDRNTDYMSFGLSGSDSGFSMIGADVVVADFKENRAPRAVDYFITAYAQCAINGGACPDTSSSNSGNNDFMMPMGMVTNGIVRIQYKRALITNDGNKDKEYKVDGTPQQIVWAIGPLNTADEAAKHYPNRRISTAKTINFGRRTMNNCPSFSAQEESGEVSFKPHHLYGRPGKTVFTAEIGQSGSTQGYMAITGRPSWGIAWYINGILIPELHLRRGVTYTFRVAGGSNSAIGAKYHPLYFTDSVEGGFSQRSAANDTIYPGTVNGVSQNIATGDYCEWKFSDGALDAVAAGYKYQCFEEYKADLTLECDTNPASYTEFKFTPVASTPDLIYYQCYTHRSLGWKMNIYDVLPATDIPAETCSRRRRRTHMLTSRQLQKLRRRFRGR